MEKVKALADALRMRVNSRPFTVVLGLLCLVGWIALIFVLVRGDGGREPQHVMQETQTEAETPAGVEHVAEQSHVSITPDQAKTAAKEIHYIYQHDTKPAYTITTTAGKAKAQAETARKAAGADFSIITDKKAPTAKTDISKLPSNSTVELNQYNVQAYKKGLHTIEVVPDIDGGGKGVSEIGYVAQRKVTKDGKYIGLGTSYNVDNHKTYAKIVYTW
jgi:cytoskeletal protein RodZ